MNNSLELTHKHYGIPRHSLGITLKLYGIPRHCLEIKHKHYGISRHSLGIKHERPRLQDSSLESPTSVRDFKTVSWSQARTFPSSRQFL